MFWPYLTFYRVLYPKEKPIRIQVRILHETDKAILVATKGRKSWIPKSRIYRIRLENNVFEIHIEESSMG